MQVCAKNSNILSTISKKVISESLGNGVNEVSVIVTSNYFPITATLRPTEWINCGSSLPLPANLIIQGNGKLKWLRLFPLDHSKAFKCFYTSSFTIGDASKKTLDSCVFSIPFEVKGKSKVILGFDSGFTHKGPRKYALDFAMPEGTPIFAARSGVVTYVQDDSNDLIRPGGNRLIILHEDGTSSEYDHLLRGSVVVKGGDKVSRGATIARSGKTGKPEDPNFQFYTPHLHFDVSVPEDGFAERVRTIHFNMVLPNGKCKTIEEGETI